MNNFSKYLLVAVMFVVSTACLSYLASIAIDKNEVAECMALKSQKAQFEGFFAENWQVEQCKAHNIEL